MDIGKRDISTVTQAGAKPGALIDGVKLRMSVTQFDQRGELCEIYSGAWSFSEEPVSYVYMAMVRPNCVKGWVYHRVQTDRLFLQSGFMKLVLYDGRKESPTYRQIDEIFLSERNRGLVTIPPFVVHAVQNVGAVDATFVNLPTVPYDHADPDKYRVPKADIPYRFDEGTSR